MAEKSSGGRIGGAEMVSHTVGGGLGSADYIGYITEGGADYGHGSSAESHPFGSGKDSSKFAGILERDGQKILAPKDAPVVFRDGDRLTLIHPGGGSGGGKSGD